MEGHDVRVYVLESTGHYGMSENCETSHSIFEWRLVQVVYSLQLYLIYIVSLAKTIYLEKRETSRHGQCTSTSSLLNASR
jgi:hypothetical protein